jgi:hypothetical protein
LHISQPTISRDIDFIRNPTNSAEKNKKPYSTLLLLLLTTERLDGIQELIKNLWLLIDNPKIGVREKMKAIKIVLYCYNMRFGLIDAEPLIKKFSDREEKVKSDMGSFKYSN